MNYWREAAAAAAGEFEVYMNLGMLTVRKELEIDTDSDGFGPLSNFPTLQDLGFSSFLHNPNDKTTMYRRLRSKSLLSFFLYLFF